MNLVSVYSDGSGEAAVPFLYQLLDERERHESISHRRMPSMGKHRRFVTSRPYLAWYLLVHDGALVGAAYITHQCEVGIAIRKSHRGRGLGSLALSVLLQAHRGQRLLANINPSNQASIALFRKHGFGGPIQITLEKP